MNLVDDGAHDDDPVRPLQAGDDADTEPAGLAVGQGHGNVGVPVVFIRVGNGGPDRPVEVPAAQVDRAPLFNREAKLVRPLPGPVADPEVDQALALLFDLEGDIAHGNA